MDKNILDEPTVIMGDSTSTAEPEAHSGSRSTPAGLNAITSSIKKEEAARARTIGLVFFLVASVTTIWSPLLDGHDALKLPVILTMGWFSIFSLYVFRLAATPERYTRRIFLAYGATAVIASTVVLIYLGPFSPTALAVTLGISFFGQSSYKTGAWLVCGSSIFLCMLLFGLILTGVVPDVGVFRGDDGQYSGMLFMTVMVPLVLLVTLMQARWSGEAVEEALEAAVESTMEASRRGVQLEEAQAELQRIAAAGGVLGHLSGRTIGSYRLGPLLGRGGSGEVYDAVDSRNGNNVAYKVIRAADADDEEMIQRFQREGEIATQLISHYVARVHQYGQSPDGTLFIAMERLDGSDLASILRSESRLELNKARDLVHDVCRGIAEAHGLGIIHRDIKPHNIFRARDIEGTEVWKVLDFGVSKLAENLSTITRGGVVGTPQYMSPEQARGEDVDARTDVYGIGAVLYRVLTGRPPMPGKGPAALFNAAYRLPEQPRRLAPDISRELEAVLGLALAPKRTDRFQTVESLSSAFEHALTGHLPRSILQQAKKVAWNTPES